MTGEIPKINASTNTTSNTTTKTPLQWYQRFLLLPQKDSFESSTPAKANINLGTRIKKFFSDLYNWSYSTKLVDSDTFTIYPDGHKDIGPPDKQVYEKVIRDDRTITYIKEIIAEENSIQANNFNKTEPS